MTMQYIIARVEWEQFLASFRILFHENLAKRDLYSFQDISTHYAKHWKALYGPLYINSRRGVDLQT